jgi:prolipoprotein diacylglyceryltransferase
VQDPAEVTDVWVATRQNPQGHTAQAIADAQLKLDAIQQALGSTLGLDSPLYERVVVIAQHSGAQFHDQVRGVLAPLLTAYYPSQIFQALSDGPILIAFLCLMWLQPRKPGVIASWWLIGYGVLRIVTELWRQPDEGVALTLGILSRGQTLSVLMILAGGMLLALSMHSKSPRMGGLLKPASKNPV